MSAAAGADHVDADDFVGLVVFDDLDEPIRVLDSLCPRDVLHLDSPTRTGAVFVHVLQFGRADGGDLGTGEDDRRDGVVVDGGPLVAKRVLDDVVALPWRRPSPVRARR